MRFIGRGRSRAIASQAPLIVAGLASSLFGACAPMDDGGRTETAFALGAPCIVRIIEGPTRGAPRAIFARIDEIDARMSANRYDSELAKINAAAGVAAVTVSPDTYLVIERALAFAELSGGAYDPTIGPLVRLWGIGTAGARIPSGREIERVRGLVDWRAVELNPQERTVMLSRPGMALDLGSIAKGYAADEAGRILAERGIEAALVDLGGNIYVHGRKSDGSPWSIGVQDPRSERGLYIGVIAGHGSTVVTSGDYERYFETGGKRYHHILDPRTGYPVESGLMSVTVIAESSIDADGLSTTLFTLGRERGMRLADELGRCGIVMIDSQGVVWLNHDICGTFSLAPGNAYRLAGGEAEGER